MQRYINSVRDHIFAICDLIRGEEGLNGADDLRVAVSGGAEPHGDSTTPRGGAPVLTRSR